MTCRSDDTGRRFTPDEVALILSMYRRHPNIEIVEALGMALPEDRVERKRLLQRVHYVARVRGVRKDADVTHAMHMARGRWVAELRRRDALRDLHGLPRLARFKVSHLPKGRMQMKYRLTRRGYTPVDGKTATFTYDDRTVRSTRTERFAERRWGMRFVREDKDEDQGDEHGGGSGAVV